MFAISQAEAMAILEPHRDGLYGMATLPWDEYHARVPSDLLVAFGPRTRASGVHDLMVREATKYAAEATGIRPFHRRLMKGIVVDDKVAIRFKKLDEDGFSAGHYTKQVEEYRGQQLLEGIDASLHLEIGYVLNADETEISEVRVVCPSGRGMAWSSTIDKTGLAPVVQDLFPNNQPPDGGAIIKPKSTGIVVPLRRQSDEDQR